MTELNYQIAIPIGDWSGDGHSACDYFYYHTNKPIPELREGYFKAKELRPDLCPENFCSAHEENEISKMDYQLLKAWFGEDFDDVVLENFDDRYCPIPEGMAEMVMRFIKEGVPDLEYKRMKQAPMLPFYGCDDQGRHIRFIGYGIFY